jgi:hypothetical protein
MEDSSRFNDVVVLFDTGMSLVFLIDGLRVRVPRHLIQSGTNVSAIGDRGTLVIPTTLAANSGLR